MLKPDCLVSRTVHLTPKFMYRENQKTLDFKTQIMTYNSPMRHMSYKPIFHFSIALMSSSYSTVFWFSRYDFVQE